MRKTILHITSEMAWQKALELGIYQADSLHDQGFIHCSLPDQVVEVANFLFRGSIDLVLLCIDPEVIHYEIKYENLQGDPELYPHIYGSIELQSVYKVIPFPPSPDGTFLLPDNLDDKP